MAGKYFEELEVGMCIKHVNGRTLTEMDNVLFTTLTMNTQPLHLNAHFAAQTPFQKPIANGILTMGFVVGLTVSELTEGTILANLSYENVRHPHPTFHGDTIYVESEILSKRESASQPDCGIVRIKHTGRNQDNVIICEVERTVMFLKKPVNRDTNS